MDKYNLNPNANAFIPSSNKYPVYLNKQSDARCDAVIEIIQDATLMCDENENTNNKQRRTDIDENDFENEEELLETLEMQHECEMEMWKMYVQAQNPTLFEQVYYDVTYPEAPTQYFNNNNNNNNNSSHVTNGNHQNYNHDSSSQYTTYSQPQQTETNGLNEQLEDLNLTNNKKSLIEMVKTNLNPNVNEFIPKSFQVQV